MSKKLLLRFMPDREKIKGIKALEFLGEKLHRPNLWHFNRRSVSLAFAVGFGPCTPRRCLGKWR